MKENFVTTKALKAHLAAGLDRSLNRVPLCKEKRARRFAYYSPNVTCRRCKTLIEQKKGCEVDEQ